MNFIVRKGKKRKIPFTTKHWNIQTILSFFLPMKNHLSLSFLASFIFCSFRWNFSGKIFTEFHEFAFTVRTLRMCLFDSLFHVWTIYTITTPVFIIHWMKRDGRMLYFVEGETLFVHVFLLVFRFSVFFFSFSVVQMKFKWAFQYGKYNRHI